MTITDDRPVEVAPPRITERNWRAFAACRDADDPDLWFPMGNGAPATEQIEALKAICNNECPVRELCLQWAFETSQDHGVWGGMSEDERRALKRRAMRERSRMGGTS